MRHTETTETLLRALRQAERLDLDKLFGSGIDVTLHHYSGDTMREHVERVTLHAEDAGPLRLALIAALSASIGRRRVSLQSQIASIDETMGKTK